MSQPAGRWVPLSLPRRLICDLMHFARQVPSIPVERHMRLGAVAAARRAAHPRPSWAALFIKAYGLVAVHRPELRRSYLSFPWPHLYEHAASTATVAVERSYSTGESAVFFAHLGHPEDRSLTEIDEKLHRCKTQPMEEIASIRRALRVARLPLPLRRLLWWLALNLSGRKRAQFIGTYGVSVYGGLGAASLHPLSVATTTLNYGVIAPSGAVDVRLVYDHRVLDGAAVARALGDLEETLRGPILAELREMEVLGNPEVDAEEPLAVSPLNTVAR
jgi:hypothetical protein